VAVGVHRHRDGRVAETLLHSGSRGSVLSMSCQQKGRGELKD
jgi:hypothetical protein